MAVRPVDAEKYMELLKEQYLHHEAMGNKQMAKAWQGAIQLLYDMPTLTPPNEWVSVEDRLPRVGGNYICAVQDKNGGKWTIPSEWNLEMKTWFGAFGEIKNKVTHWMPLPAPPDRRPPEGEEET